MIELPSFSAYARTKGEEGAQGELRLLLGGGPDSNSNSRPNELQSERRGDAQQPEEAAHGQFSCCLGEFRWCRRRGWSFGRFFRCNKDKDRYIGWRSRR